MEAYFIKDNFKGTSNFFTKGDLRVELLMGMADTRLKITLIFYTQNIHNIQKIIIKLENLRINKQNNSIKFIIQKFRANF